MLAGLGLSSCSRTAKAPVAANPQIYDFQPDPDYNTGLPLRPMDVDILTVLAKGQYSAADVGDLFPRRPYHVKLVGSPGEHHIDVLFIDLERDGTWDERWQLKPAAVARLIVDKSGRTGGIPFVLRKGRWLAY